MIDLLRGHPLAVDWAQSRGAQRSAITPIVWMEIAQGAQNNRELLELTRFLRQFHIEHPTIADNNWAMRQFGRFNLSHKIDMADVMIASVAVRLAVPLYTLNIRHYEPLPDVDEQRPY